jgi:hypothetical protein
VKPEDLGDTERVLELHHQAVTLGWTKDTEPARLETVALAERAKRVGERPAALFRFLLQNRRREFITDGDEERARQRMSALRNHVPEFVRELLGSENTPKVAPLTREEWASMTELERAQHRLLQLRAEQRRVA